MASLLDLKQLDIEGQLAVGGDARHAAGAISEVGRNGQASLTTNGHANDADVPALDDLSLTGLEGERLALLVGCEVNELVGPSISELRH